MTVAVSDELLELLPQKAVFWPSCKILLVADLHLGKVSHFRRAGIPVPVKAHQAVLERLVEMLTRLQPRRVLFLGDLFHSHYNQDWEEFGELVRYFSNVSFELVTGNHDILSPYQYLRKNITVHPSLLVGPFLLTHAPGQAANGHYNLAGHVHPGVQLTGRGRQSVTLPCFYFGRNAGLLPPFGVFTGMARILPEQDSKVFVVSDNEVIAVR